MSQPPLVSGREVVKALRKIGYEQDRQHGSHIILRQTVPPHRRVTIRAHHEVAKGTLRAIIQQVSLTVDEFKGRCSPDDLHSNTIENTLLRPYNPN